MRVLWWYRACDCMEGVESIFSLELKLESNVHICEMIQLAEVLCIHQKSTHGRNGARDIIWMGFDLARMMCRVGACIHGAHRPRPTEPGSGFRGTGRRAVALISENRRDLWQDSEEYRLLLPFVT